MRSSFLVHAERRRMLSQRQEQNTDLAAANPSKKSGYKELPPLRRYRQKDKKQPLKSAISEAVWSE